MDNASMNDVLAHTLGILLLKRYKIHFSPKNWQICCLAHVVNLIVQKILHELFEANDPALQDYYDLYNKHLPFHFDPDTDEENQHFQAEGKEERAKARASAQRTEQGAESMDGEQEGDEEDKDDLDALLEGEHLGSEVAGTSAVKKLRLIVTKILSSPQCRSHFRKVAAEVYKKATPEDEHCHKLIVICDVATRWNYKHAMIERTLLLQGAIELWLLWNKPLRTLMLTNTEWDTLKKLGSLLEVFTKVTKEMSRLGTPTLPFVIPMYHHMQVELKKRIEDI
ncbi:hypothetical protein V8D89_002964 [Ganoderma adspersum]